MRIRYMTWILGATVAVSAGSQALAPQALAQRPRPLVRKERRAELEEAYRARTEQVLRTQLNLTDDQVVKLRDVTGKLSGRRRDLGRRERDTRAALRLEVARGKDADQSHVSKLMNDAQDLAKQRLELQEEERKEVSKFLSPVQQAKYFGLQSKIRKRAQELEREQEQGKGKGQEETPSE